MTNLVKITKKLQLPETSGRYYRLLCLTGEKKGTVYYLQAKRLVLGRSEKAHIQIMDAQSSREHVELVLVGDGYILTDLGSQNGVVVNDLNVRQHKLLDNDKIIIGHTVFKYSIDDVKEVQNDLKNEIDDDGDKKDDGEFKKSKNKKIIYIILALGLAYLFLLDEEPTVVQKKTLDTGTSTGLSNKKIAKESIEDIESEKKYLKYLHRGKRDYREKNYFRAMEEFRLADMVRPGDGNVAFNIEKAKQRIDEIIKGDLEKGTRDIASLRYSSAIVAYCKIVRLLQNYANDERRKIAEIQLEVIEKNTSRMIGEIKCYEGHTREGER